MNIRNLGRVNLNDGQRQQVGEAADVLERLAGADGIWNHRDVERNVGQLKSSGNLLVGLTDFFSPSAIPGRFQAGLDSAGVRRDGYPPFARTSAAGARAGNQEISKAELEKFQSTMDMLRKRSAASPVKVTFKNGVPVSLLRAMADGRSVIPSLLQAGVSFSLKR